MVDWMHKVDEQWLKERRNVVTATELVHLVPEFKRAEKAGRTNEVWPAFAALWEQKHSEIEPDPYSFKAAARGHYCEPYAIESWNKQTSVKMYHWDDCIICNNGLGFSPDGMNIEQPSTNCVRLDIDGKSMVGKGVRIDLMPTSLVEVKSYDIDHHTKSMVSNKMSKQLESERMQMAVAMMVVPTLEEVNLILFCPPARHSMAVRTYTKEELSDEISLLEKVLSMWQVTCREMNAYSEPFVSAFSEKEIESDYEAETQDAFVI